MTNDSSELSTDELIERFDRGEDLIDYNQDLLIMESASGPMKMTSVRLPEVLLLALEKAEGSNSDRSSMIRTSVCEWLKENNPEALIDAKRQVEDQLDRDNHHRASA